MNFYFFTNPLFEANPIPSTKDLLAKAEEFRVRTIVDYIEYRPDVCDIKNITIKKDKKNISPLMLYITHQEIN